MRFTGWDKVEINTGAGVVKGIAPVIISASRSTDIPGFHGDWFVRHLQAGYVTWVNPFNQKMQYISFSQARVIVFWTKNPRPMLQYLPVIDKMGIQYYFTFTLNDYEKEGFEPGVLPLSERVNSFKALAKKIGKERVVWRFDPLILTDELDVEELLARIRSLATQLQGYTEKLVVSFIDINDYAKVSRNLRSKGYRCQEFDLGKIHQMAAGLQQLGREFSLNIATCGEKVDLAEYGIVKNKCIDDQLMYKIFKNDNKLMKFLGRDIHEISLFGEEMPVLDLKDKGQREACGCIVSKDIGQYNTCLHLCNYCYANHSEQVVKSNLAKSKDGFFEGI